MDKVLALRQLDRIVQYLKQQLKNTRDLALIDALRLVSAQANALDHELFGGAL